MDLRRRIPPVRGDVDFSGVKDTAGGDGPARRREGGGGYLVEVALGRSLGALGGVAEEVLTPGARCFVCGRGRVLDCSPWRARGDAGIFGGGAVGPRPCRQHRRRGDGGKEACQRVRVDPVNLMDVDLRTGRRGDVARSWNGGVCGGSGEEEGRVICRWRRGGRRRVRASRWRREGRGWR
jgi:hypothetical protein